MFFPVQGDPYRDNVVLHVPMTGANNSTTFTDISPSPKTITRVGDIKISTDQSKWGQGSGYLDGNVDSLTATVNSLGTGDFTLEVFVYVITPSSFFFISDSRDQDSTNNGFAFYVRSTTHLTYGRGDPFQGNEGTLSLSPNTWYHCALSRSSGTVRGFLNGVKDIEVEDTKNFSLTNWRIGNQWNASGTFSQGYLQDFRITLGVARYINNFTPPDLPLPARATDKSVNQPFMIDPSFPIARLGI